MKVSFLRNFTKSTSLAGMGTLAALALATSTAFAQGVPDDWSSRHVVFSSPGSMVDAIREGRLDRWNKTVNDPRYLQQLKRRGQLKTSGSGPGGKNNNGNGRDDDRNNNGRDDDNNGRGGDGGDSKSSGTPGIHRDWSMSMGSGARVGAGQFPAKYSFDTTTANCAIQTTPDFVVYNTSLAGSASQATIMAFDNLYSGCAGTKPTVYWSYNTGAGAIAKTSPILSLDGKQVAFVHSAASTSTLVILKWKAGEGNTPGNAVSAASIPVIPTTNTSTAATYVTCRNAGTTSCELTLQFSASATDTRSAPFYDYANDALYVGDDAGVLHKFTGVFSGTPAEVTGGGTSSGWPQTMASATVLTSPVYDSGTSNVFVVGGGILYRIPATGGSTNKVASTTITTVPIDAPIVDSQAGRVYVVGPGSTSQAVLAQWATNFGPSAIATTVNLGGTTTDLGYTGAFDNAYFTSTATSPTGSFYVCNPNSTNERLWRVPITANAMGTPVNLMALTNAGANCSPITEFYNDSVASTTLSAAITTTGATSMTVTATTGLALNDYVKIDSEIVKISAIAANTLTITRATLGTTANTHLNGATVTRQPNDRLFVGITASGSTTGCTGACIYEIDITAGQTPAASMAGLASAGGTSGIVIDNKVGSGTQAGAAQIYYTPLSNQVCGGNTVTGNATGGCAVQASQAALQ